jgi:hypothetical protein
MRTRLASLLARRDELVARSRVRRGELVTITARLQDEIGWLDSLIGAARSIRRPGALIGAAAVALAIVGPSRLLRLVPFVQRFYQSLRPSVKDRG